MQKKDSYPTCKFRAKPSIFFPKLSLFSVKQISPKSAVVDGGRHKERTILLWWLTAAK